MHYMKWIYPRRLRNQMILMAILMVIVPTLTIGYIVETGNDSNLLIVFYVQIMPDDFVMQLHRF